jgi:hypothetical protein
MGIALWVILAVLSIAGYAHFILDYRRLKKFQREALAKLQQHEPTIESCHELINLILTKGYADVDDLRKIGNKYKTAIAEKK